MQLAGTRAGWREVAPGYGWRACCSRLRFMRLFHAIVCWVGLCSFACGGKTSTLGAPARERDDGGGDADSGYPESGAGDAGCLIVAPAPGSACTEEMSVCVSGDIGCVGYWTCASNTWQHSFPGAPCRSGPDAGPPQRCGSTTCTAEEHCTNNIGGSPPLPDGGSRFSTEGCTANPPTCRDAPTCACILASIPGSNFDCTCAVADGHPFVTCKGP